MRVSRLICVLSALLSVAACTGRGNQLPAEVQKAKVLFEQQASTTWRLAHPTVKQFDSLQFDEYQLSPSGCTLKFTFRWRKGDVPHVTQVGFRCSPAGTISGVDLEDVLQVLHDSAKVDAFAVTDVVAKPVRGEIKAYLSGVPGGVDAELKHLVEQKMSGRALAALWLLVKEKYPSQV